MFFAAMPSTPTMQGGFVNPLTGKEASSAVVVARPKSGPAGGGHVGRVKKLQQKINDLERSAMQMYSQVMSLPRRYLLFSELQIL